MALTRTDFENLSERDLQALKDNSVSEGIFIDYKRVMYSRSDAENKEFLKDASSFANTAGGHILIGVKEEEGLPIEITGIDVDCDAEKSRLENLLRDRIEPRIVGIRMQPVSLSNGKRVLVIRIPRSWNLPHAVLQNKARLIYARNSAGVHEASVDEMRVMFIAGATFLDRARQFQRDRIEQVHASQGPLTNLAGEGGRIILHIVPFSAFSSEGSLDVSSIHGQYLPPLWSSGYNQGYNADGFYTISSGSSRGGYVQVFRNGIVESAAGDVRNELAQARVLYAEDLENEVSNSVKNFLAALSHAEVPPPMLIMLSGVRMHGTMTIGNPLGRPVEVLPLNSTIAFPDITIDNYSGIDDYRRALRPIFDAVWNAAGYPKSLSFDKDGNWAPRRS